MKTINVFPNTTSKEEAMFSLEDPRQAANGDNMMTFPEFVNFLRGGTFHKTYPLDDTGRLILLTHIFRRHLNRGSGCFGAIRGSVSGMVSNLGMLFDQLKQSLISSETFRDAVSLTSIGQGKGDELFQLYSDYERLLTENNLVDLFDRERQALEILLDENAARKVLRGVSEVRFENLYNPSLLRFEIIRALAMRVGDIKVAIPYNAGRQDAFSFLEKTVRLFEQLNVEETQYYEPKDIWTVDYGQRRPFIDDILRHIFKSPAELTGLCLEPDEQAISITASQSMRCEVEMIGRSVKRLLREGVSPRKIGVVFRSLAAYGKCCEDVFKRYQIPAAFRRGKPLSETPLMRMIFSILDTARENLNSGRVLALLRSGYTNFRDKFYKCGFGDVELIILHSAIVDDAGDGWERKLDRFEESLKRGTAYQIEPEKVSELRRHLCPLLRKLRILRKGMTYKEFFAGLLELIDYLGIPENIEEGESAIVERDIASLEAINNLIESSLHGLALCGREQERVSLDDFYNFFLRVARTRELSAGKCPAPGVRVINPYDVIGLKFDYLFLGGLVEGEFPEPKYDNPLLIDSEKREFNEALQKLAEVKGALREVSAKHAFRETEDRFMEEPLLFCLVLACARKCLYLSYSELNETGSLNLPSTLLKALLRLMERRREDGSKEELWRKVFHKASAFPLPDYEEAGNSLELLSKLTEEMRLTGAAGEIELKAGNMGLGRRLNLCTGNIKIEEERDRFSQEPDPEKKRDLAGAYTGKITDGQILEDIRDMALGDTEIRWSALLFEEFARDPFVFYLKRVLKLSEIEAGTIEPRALTAGSLTHEILRRFFGKLPGGDILSGEDPHAIADEVMEETFGEFRVSGEITDESFWRIKEREIKKAVHNFAAFETERMKSSLASGSAPLPSLYEFAFGGRKNPFSLKLGELPLHIHGRVDRVDLDDKGGVAAVYDYKYSASGKQMEAVRKTLIGRRRFQLGVYLLAVKRYLSNNLKWKAPFSLKAGIYLLRNNPSSPGSFYREIEFDDEIIKTLKEGIEKIVRLVISGRFDSL